MLGALTLFHICKWTLTGQHTLHGLARGHHRTRIGLAGQLALHLGQPVDGEVHSDIVDALEAIGRLATGHMLEDDVIELMHQHAQLVLIFKRTHELGIVKKLELGTLRIDAHTSSRDRGGRGLVDPTRESREERLAHQEARGVKVQVERLVRHVKLLATL